MCFLRQIVRYALFIIILLPMAASAAQPLRIVALGDSLTAGYGLLGGEDFASQLQTALKARQLDVKIDNAGVSGDTTAGGLARLNWSISGMPTPRLVIVALGGNDLLRGIAPTVTKANLQSILQQLQAQKIPALLIGMRSPPNMGPDFQHQFDAIYPDLAKQFNVPLYPFFLDGVALNAKLNLPDGVHPTAAGVKIIADKVAPVVAAALK